MKAPVKAFYGALFAAFLMAAPLIADARPYGHGHGFGDCYNRGTGDCWSQAIPEDKRDAVRALMQTHYEKVQPIHDTFWVKKTSLHALKNNPNVKPAELTALIDEMASLQTKLREEHKAFAARVKKDTGVDLPYGFGMQGSGFMPCRGMDGDRPGGRHGGYYGGYYGGKGPR